MKTKKSVISQFILIIAVLVLVNLLGDRYFARLDFTADKRYTLSKATKDILRNLEEPVTVTAYFTVDLPTQFTKTRSDFKDMLIEYANVSKGNVVYEFVDPNKDQEVEMQAMQQGIQPVLINVREKDQSKQQKAFMGAVIQMGEQSEVVPFIQQGSGMEYTLSSNIKKLSVIDKPVLGYLQGHGEPPVNHLQQVMGSLNVLYMIEPFSLSDTMDVLSRYITVAILNPTDTIPQHHLDQLDRYLAGGGNLFIGYNRVTGDLNTTSGNSVYTGLEDWMAEKGLVIEDNFVVDANCASVGVRQQMGPIPITSNVQFPYLPIINNFADHPITSGLEAVVLPFASSMTYMGDSSITYIPIAFTSENSGTERSPVYFNIQKRWTKNDFPLKDLPVAAILSGKLVGNTMSNMVVVADGDFAINGEQAQQLQPDNVSLMVNAIDYLSDDTGLIELRTRGVTLRPIKQLEDSTKALLKWLNFLLPILIIVIYGILRMQHNRNLRVKRMEEGYV